METTNEGEGDSLTTSTTASDQIIEEPQARDIENNDSQFKQMLTCETGNTGTEVNTPPCDKRTTGQGLHGSSPANDNLDKVQDAILSIKLEARDEVAGSEGLEGPMELEVASSDESGDWETASEASVECEEETTDFKGEMQNENVDSNGKLDNSYPEETVDHLQIQTISGHQQQTGSEGTEKLAEEIEHCCERTCSKDLQSEQAFAHETMLADTVREESLCDVRKTESKEILPYAADETSREGKVSEESDPNVEEKGTEESMSHFANTEPEKLNYEESVKEPSTGGSVTDIEKSGPHNEEAAIKRTMLHGENCSHNEDAVTKGIETQMEELQQDKSVYEKVRPQLMELVCEVREHHADKNVSLNEVATQMCKESPVEMTNHETTVPDSNEFASTESEAYVVVISSEQSSTLIKNADGGGAGNHGEETISGHIESHAKESVSEVTKSLADTNQPYVKETLRLDSEPCFDERDCEETVTNNDDCVTDKTGPCTDEIVSKGTLSKAGDSGSGGESETSTHDTVSGEVKTIPNLMQSTEFEGSHITKVFEENDKLGCVTVKKQSLLDMGTCTEFVHSKIEAVNNEEMVDSRLTIKKDSSVDQNEITEGDIENFTECVSEETANKVIAHLDKEGVSQLLDCDTKCTFSIETTGVGTEIAFQEMSGEETVNTENVCIYSQAANEHTEDGHQDTVIQLTVIGDTLGDYTESTCNKTDDGSIEMFNVDTPFACEEICIKYSETVTENVQTDSSDAIEYETSTWGMQTTDSKESVNETADSDLSEIQEISNSNSKEKQNEEIYSSIEKTIEQGIEPSSEEGELVKQRENQERVELTALSGFKELYGEFSDSNNQNQKYIGKESTAAVNESESNKEEKSLCAEETGLQAPKEDGETMSLKIESSNISPGEIDAKQNNLESNIRFSKELLETTSHRRAFEIDVDQAAYIYDESSNMDLVTDIGTSVDTTAPLDETVNTEIEEGEVDTDQSLHDTEINSIPVMPLKPISVGPIDFTIDSLQNLDAVREPEEPNTHNFEVVDVVKNLNDPYHKNITDSLYRELSSPSEETLSLGLEKETDQREDQEQIQSVIQTVRIVGPQTGITFSEILEDNKELVENEQDCFNQGFIFDQGLTSDTFLPKTELFTKPETGKIFVQEATLTVAAEPILADRTLSHRKPVVDDQDKAVSDIKPGQHSEEGTRVNILPSLITRQRSNTDPCLSYDNEEEYSTQQDDPHGIGKPRLGLRSVTPPLDNFTASFTAKSSEAILENKPLEKAQTSIVYPAVDHNISGEQKAEEATPKKDYTFLPTQIFNPLFYIQEGMEEHGYYQEKPLLQHVKENINKRRFPSPPPDSEVLLKLQQPPTINTPNRSPASFATTMETSATDQPVAHPVAPVWLPPRPLRHSESTVGKEFRPLKPTESPLVRRPTVRHKKNTVANPAFKRFGAMNLPLIPQEVPSGDTSSLEKTSRPAGTRGLVSSTRLRPLPRQVKTNEQDTGQQKNKSPMERLAEAEERKSTRSPEAVLKRGKHSQIQPSTSDLPHSKHRYSTIIRSYSLLYQEYSDVALNQEIQRQKPGDSVTEEKDPGSPRQRRRILSSQDSYLQRLSISSADSLWQDLPKIRDSVTFMSMSREEQKLQEAKFELIMSEALYLRSLNIAVDHFQRSMELQEVLSAQDRQWLFSRLSEVRDASNDFLFDLEEEFENNMYNFQVCDVVISHEPNFRKVYLPYVTNQSYQDRTFQGLMHGNPRFQQVLSKLESDPVCQRLSLKSFLILPFQRITRLRLLLQNILKRSAPGSNEELQATEAHNAIEKLIRDCNEGVQKMKDTEQLILLHQKIQFECKIFPLISASRRLVKHGEITCLEFNPISFKWKGTTRQIYLHLFSDCLLLSRTREGGRFVVFDHASDFRVERCEIKLHSNQKNIFRVFLRDSAASQARDGHVDGQEMQYIFRTETQSQKLRWIYALSPPKEEIDFLRDGLPQVQCLKSYKARENDELSLEKADILMVTQNSDDGWLCGMRLSDLHSGWFPQSHVRAISRNACLRNLQEEQRLQNARAKLHPTGAK